MLIIRYRRIGKKNYAQYKIVVAERSFSVKGKFVESLGSYDPHNKEAVLKEDRIKYWIGVGAQCSDSVHNLLVSKGLIKKAKRKISFKEKIKETVEKGEDNLPAEGSNDKDSKEEPQKEKPTEEKETSSVEKEDSKEKNEEKIEKPEVKTEVEVKEKTAENK